ncbi:MAG: hypothetical protein ABL986_03105 [Vicinamibacterales bacterium]
MAIMDDVVQTTEARNRIALAGGVALLVAGLILVMFVLPAEYAVDPLGVGARTGLLDLGVTGQQVEALTASAPTAAGQAAIIVPQERKFQQEDVTFTLGPKEGMEYKYRLDKGQALLFAWTASVPVSYEAHAEPDGAPRGYAQSYEKGAGRANASGTLTAPFPGIHGWYWENPTDQPITVTLSTSGFYTLSHEFRTGAPTKNKTFQ